MPYAPPLDGLRALAVIAVIVFHQNVNWLPAGFLGVDIFFVVSGYLITALLVQEYRTASGIALPSFWARRARRLLPALYALLIGVTAYAAWQALDALGALRTDVPAAFFYVTNWVAVFGHHSYFANLGRPPLLQHLWSLAIEEQFYLVWPVVLLAGLRLTKGNAERLVPAVVAGALGSTLLMAHLYVPDSDPSRVYYGTDTHSMGLLVGAALALWWAPWRWPIDRQSARNLDIAAVVGALVLLLVMWRADGYSLWLFRGGFLFVALVTAVIVAAVVQPGRGGPARVLLAHPLLVWIGVRSYALYLWHWPIFQLMRPADVHLDGFTLFVVRLAVTFVCAELSYRLVESYFRHPPSLAVRRRVPPEVRRQRFQTMSALAVTLVFVLSVVLVTAKNTSNAVPIGGETIATVSPTVPVVTQPAPSAPPPSAPAVTTAAPVAGPRRVVVVGDSQARALVANAPAVPGVQLFNGGVEGCGLEDTGSMSTTAHYRRTFTECQGWDAKWGTAARANRAQLALVVIGAWDVFDLHLPTGDAPFGSAAHDAYLTSQLERGIAQLKAAGAQVALMQVPCYRPIDAGGLIRLPERADDARTRHLGVLFQRVARRDPHHVFFVRTAADFCTNPSVGTGIAYRWDGVHYLRPGASLVLATVVPQLLRIPLR
jgi:peptidoglycan/LPS O-acetylase OafA/YrhL